MTRLLLFLTAYTLFAGEPGRVTVLDRPDIRTRPALDQLAKDLLAGYKAEGGKILTAKMIGPNKNNPFQYIVVAFEQPARKGYELRFVKAAMGHRNACVTIYTVRVDDVKTFLQTQLESIEKEFALSQVPLRS